MKLNWGNALLLFFILYIGLLVRIVIKSFQVDHSLVVNNYYEHDIRYQDKLDKISNRSLLTQDLRIKLNPTSNTLSLDFGSLPATQEAIVELYRASDQAADFTRVVRDFKAQTLIQLGDLQPGRWKVKVEWKDLKRTYYKEKNIYI